MGEILCGYASVFGVVDGQNDLVAPGAFRRSLARHRSQSTMPLMFYEHEPGDEIGFWSLIEEDAHGLWVEGIFRERWYGSPQKSFRYARGLSMGFDVFRTYREGGIRILQELELIEISIVQGPANPLSILLK